MKIVKCRIIALGDFEKTTKISAFKENFWYYHNSQVLKYPLLVDFIGGGGGSERKAQSEQQYLIKKKEKLMTIRPLN